MEQKKADITTVIRPRMSTQEYNELVNQYYINNSKTDTAKTDTTSTGVVGPKGAQIAHTRPYTMQAQAPVDTGLGIDTVDKQTDNGNDNTHTNGLSSLQSLYEQQQNALSAQIKEQQALYTAQLKAQQEARQQAAQNAYNSNMAALEAAYKNRLAGLESNYNSTKNALASSYENSVGSLTSDAEKALQEAYINRMMNEKSLRQQLNAQGLNGGASESVMAALLNNYGTSRNNINTATLDNLRSLEEAYNQNLASAAQNYNDALNSAADTNMAYRMQLENDLANGITNSYSDLYSALSGMDNTYANSMINLINGQSSAAADLQQSLYKAILNNSLGGSGDLNTSDATVDPVISNAVNQVKQLYQNGNSVEDIIGDLLYDYTTDQIVQIFSEAEINY